MSVTAVTSSIFSADLKGDEADALFHQQPFQACNLHECWRFRLFLGQSAFLLPVGVLYTHLGMCVL
jgi:hypothetical protein